MKTVRIAIDVPETMSIDELFKTLKLEGYKATLKFEPKRKTPAKPLLDAFEIGILLLTTYEEPRRWVGKEGVTADHLAKLGLLEEDLSALTWYRRTEAGKTYLDNVYRRHKR